MGKNIENTVNEKEVMAEIVNSLVPINIYLSLLDDQKVEQEYIDKLRLNVQNYLIKTENAKEKNLNFPEIENRYQNFMPKIDKYLGFA